MTAAGQVLAELPGYRVLVVGDRAELGAESEACHVQVGEAAKAAGIDRVLSVGKQSHAISTARGVGEHFSDKTRNWALKAKPAMCRWARRQKLLVLTAC